MCLDRRFGAGQGLLKFCKTASKKDIKEPPTVNSPCHCWTSAEQWQSMRTDSARGLEVFYSCETLETHCGQKDMSFLVGRWSSFHVISSILYSSTKIQSYFGTCGGVTIIQSIPILSDLKWSHSRNARYTVTIRWSIWCLVASWSTVPNS